MHSPPSRSHASSTFRRVKRRLLLAEGDAELRHQLTAALEREGFDVHAAEDGRAVLAALTGVARGTLLGFDALVLDVSMRGLTGTRLLLALRLAEWCVPVVLTTGCADPATLVAAQDLGAACVLQKPFALDALLAWLPAAEILVPCAAG